MSASPLSTILFSFTLFIWPVLSLFMVAAGILLVRAEPRAHVVAFLIGAVIASFLAFAQLLLHGPGFGLVHRQDWGIENHQQYALITSGVSFIGQGLMAFGLLSFAIVHLRRTRQERNFD